MRQRFLLLIPPKYVEHLSFSDFELNSFLDENDQLHVEIVHCRVRCSFCSLATTLRLPLSTSISVFFSFIHDHQWSSKKELKPKTKAVIKPFSSSSSPPLSSTSALISHPTDSIDHEPVPLDIDEEKKHNPKDFRVTRFILPDGGTCFGVKRTMATVCSQLSSCQHSI
jgi:hypothetical protein